MDKLVKTIKAHAPIPTQDLFKVLNIKYNALSRTIEHDTWRCVVAPIGPPGLGPEPTARPDIVAEVKVSTTGIEISVADYTDIDRMRYLESTMRRLYGHVLRHMLTME